VGVLLLVIGYLSPVPPAREDDLAGGPGDDPALAHVEGGDPS
jgi:hypothetical protein